MAAAPVLSSANMLSALFPRLAQSSQWLRFSRSSPTTSLLSSPAASPAVPAASISLGIPAILSDLWDSVLRAVPKKKTSHMKKRHRQMAGKALKDHLDINTCSGCGKPKRAHLLCPTCVSEIRQEWREAEKKAKTS